MKWEEVVVSGYKNLEIDYLQSHWISFPFIPMK